jgi:hypothetical protein
MSSHEDGSAGDRRLRTRRPFSQQPVGGFQSVGVDADLARFGVLEVTHAEGSVLSERAVRVSGLIGVEMIT